MALINEDKDMSKSPQESCSVMSKALAALGGAMDYAVPPEVEAEFLSEIPSNPPATNFAPPTWDQFQAIIRRPKPQKAVGIDNLNLYLTSILPEPFQHWFYFLVKRVMTLDIPQSWLEAEFFLLP